MLKDIIENEEVKRKAGLLREAGRILKEEFVGIDDVIDGVLTNIRPWFLYPDLQDKPLVISLVGLTGTGKTSLIKRFTELIDMEDNLAYFNFAEIGEMKSWELEDTIDESINNGKPDKIFVYDEFQYAATLDGDGCEKDNKTGLKPFWELMDSGCLHRRADAFDIYRAKKLLDYMHRINDRCPMNIVNGMWVNRKECLSNFSDYDVSVFDNIFWVANHQTDDEGTVMSNPSNPMSQDTPQIVSDDTRHMFIKSYYVDHLRSLYNRSNPVLDEIDFHAMLCKMNASEIMSFISGIVKSSEKGYDMNFSKSAIFVMMNLDEAYEMSFNVDPDMLPDQFHKMTKKLTIVDIKEALRKRFRNEQIGRLGNLFMIYPSFSEDSFKKIITLLLNRYAKAVSDKWGINIEFDETVRDLIYKDSVFPTHGTRPIISSVHEIVKTKLPLVVDSLAGSNVSDVDTMIYSYANGKMHVDSYLDGAKVGEADIEQPLRVENHREAKDKDQQALVAMHESGHFVMYAKLTGKMPEKLCSITINKNTGGFMLKDDDEADKIKSREDCMNSIKVSLAGYVAEKMVFGGDKRTVGASSDLESATVMAGSMVRKFGLGNRPDVTTYLTSPDLTRGGMIIKDASDIATNSEIRAIISTCMADVENTFRNAYWKRMLKESALYLSDHTVMPKEKMLELYETVPENLRVDFENEYYRNCINNF